jgi:hypothetical protein
MGSRDILGRDHACVETNDKIATAILTSALTLIAPKDIEGVVNLWVS